MPETVNRIEPTDPRADRLTYVAVCRDCGGWKYLGDAENNDAEMKRYHKRAAGHCIERNCDFIKVRFGDVNLTMCECLRAKKESAKQEALAI